MSLSAVLHKTNGETFGDAQSQIQQLKALFPNAKWDQITYPFVMQDGEAWIHTESDNPIRIVLPIAMCTIVETQGSIEIYIYDKGPDPDFLSLSIYGIVLPQFSLDTLAKEFSGIVTDTYGNVLAEVTK